MNAFAIAGVSGASDEGWVDVAAPGRDILSTVPGGYADKTGTRSMSSPHVAGLLAPQNRSARNIKKRITSTAVDLGSGSRDIYYGRINAYADTRK